MLCHLRGLRLAYAVPSCEVRRQLCTAATCAGCPRLLPCCQSVATCLRPCTEMVLAHPICSVKQTFTSPILCCCHLLQVDQGCCHSVRAWQFVGVHALEPATTHQQGRAADEQTPGGERGHWTTCCSLRMCCFLSIRSTESLSMERMVEAKEPSELHPPRLPLIVASSTGVLIGFVLWGAVKQPVCFLLESLCTASLPALLCTCNPYSCVFFTQYWCVVCAVLPVVQAWEQQLQQTQKAWKAMHHRLAAVIAAAEQRRRQREQEQAAGSPMGVRGLAASRAQGRQVRRARCLYGWGHNGSCQGFLLGCIHGLWSCLCGYNYTRAVSACSKHGHSFKRSHLGQSW